MGNYTLNFTASEINEQLSKISATDDYIVELGETGIWTYEKWNSGKAVCWGSITINPTSWSAWGNLYEAQPGLSTQAFPSPLFIEAPKFFVKATSDQGIAGVECSSVVYKTATPVMYALRPNAGSTTYPITFHMKAIGKWK